MKVVDMFSGQTPCLAIYYRSIDELVLDKVYGRVFKDSDELANQLHETLKGFDSDNQTETLRRYSENLKEFQKESWEEQWDRVVRQGPLSSILPGDDRPKKE